jgi:hypothetical protein
MDTFDRVANANDYAASNLPPPLRIHHLLVWTALTAAIISGCMTFDRTFRNAPPITNRVVIAGLVLGAATIAGAFTVSGEFYFCRRRDIEFPTTPGEWLLLEITWCTLAFCALAALFLMIASLFGDDDWFPAYYLFAGVVALVGWLRLQQLGWKRYSNSAAWRRTFIALMLSPLAVWNAMTFLMLVLAVIACVLWAAWVDWRNGNVRRWTHWCGVVLTVSLGISLLCVFVR